MRHEYARMRMADGTVVVLCKCEWYRTGAPSMREAKRWWHGHLRRVRGAVL